MCLRQSVRVTIRPMNGESLDTLDTLQIHEASKGYTRRACGEAEDLRPLFTVERFECSPPPNDNGIRASVSVVLCSSTPFVYVDIGSA